MDTQIFQVNPEYPEYAVLKKAAELVRKGGLVIFPTETVYGIAADPENPKAMDRLRALKHRSGDKPFTRMISDYRDLQILAEPLSPALYKVMDHYWPGPLTIVVPVRNGNGSVGIRMPDHLVASKFVELCERPLAVPSANPEGEPPPTDIIDAMTYFKGQVDGAIDAGPSLLGQSSTVVDFTVPAGGHSDGLDKSGAIPPDSDAEYPFRVLRKGAVGAGEIQEIMSKKSVLFVCTGNSCRSVMAEYFFRDLVKDREDLDVSSAGTSVFMQSGASAETVEILRREGIDARGHVSRKVTPTMLKKSDLILAMTRAHRNQIVHLAPEVQDRVFLLREFADIPARMAAELEIPDPIGRSRDAYEECARAIKDALKRIGKLV